MAKHLDKKQIKKIQSLKQGWQTFLVSPARCKRKGIIQTHWYHPHICECQTWLWYPWFTVIPLEEK